MRQWLTQGRKIQMRQWPGQEEFPALQKDWICLQHSSWPGSFPWPLKQFVVPKTEYDMLGTNVIECELKMPGYEYLIKIEVTNILVLL